MDRLWLTGYRSYEMNVYGDSDPKLPIIKETLKNQLIQALDNGMTWLISGGELGTEQWGLEVGIALKADYPDLQTSLMTPFTDFGSRWQEDNQDKLSALKAQVDFTASVSQAPYQKPAQLSGYMQFMLQHTDGALLLYDPEVEGKPKFQYAAIQRYQENHDYPLTLITLEDLEEEARNLADQQNDYFQN
ncbi:DUF1273 domain-containing protein [Lacticaseibacillus saniviri]|uniref:UPF0398 protein IV56_GL001349 n=1 Tax=Lacticaseibacillus saniviri JCM 17471 = DSM 24301 TaxID=1293598 RepID=A0A0R2N575_9LACO|nr:DUF1273 domain-containing protein [Lacticaseibacillus saniviri]KRO18218.1 hypothetical protein IV56_GL001349 [Lacticaseibacillus saniviri JCM 17471 = DSM 24301]MCG4282725.1 DUF1273 domain-containing protein [Lacticaseibacillus saniviri]